MAARPWANRFLRLRAPHRLAAWTRFMGLLGACLSGCAKSADASASGRAEVTVLNVPLDARCVAVGVDGGDVRRASVAAGSGPPPVVAFDGIPAGTATFRATGFAAGCDDAKGDGEWIADPQTVAIAADGTAHVELRMRSVARTSPASWDEARWDEATWE